MLGRGGGTPARCGDGRCRPAGRGRLPTSCGRTRRGAVGADGAGRRWEGRHHGQPRVDPAPAVWPRGAQAAVAARARGRVRGRFAPGLAHERPPGLAPRAERPTHPVGVRDATGWSGVEPSLPRPPDRPPLVGTAGLGQGAVAHPMPPRDPLARLRPHGFPHGWRRSPTRAQGGTIAPPVGPPPRPAPRGRPAIRTPALGAPPAPRPQRSWATWPRRHRRTTQTVTQAVTAVHGHARGGPARHPASSTDAAGCWWTEARAAATGSATAGTGGGSRCARGPTRRARQRDPPGGWGGNARGPPVRRVGSSPRHRGWPRWPRRGVPGRTRHRRPRPPCPRRPVVAGLSAGATVSGLTARPRPAGLGWSARRRAHGGARVGLPPVGHVLDRRCPALAAGRPRRHAGCARPEICRRLHGRARPARVWPWAVGLQGRRRGQESWARQPALLAAPT